MKIAARAIAVQPFYAMSIGERVGILQAEGHPIAKFSLGEPDFGVPPAVREEMRRVMDGRPLSYSPTLGLFALREAIVGFYRGRHDVEVGLAWIVVTTGTFSVLLLVAVAATQPGDDVVIADPSYPCNRQLVETYGGRVVLAPTSPVSRYWVDRAAAEAAWTPQTSVAMLAILSNPTDTSIPFEELASICALARERSVWRTVDEIYLGLADPNEDGAPARTVLETNPEAIVISSFSKYFGMAGWRLGWATPPEGLVAPAENLAVNYFLCALTPVQQAMLAAFSPGSISVCEQRRQEFSVHRSIVFDGLERIGLPVSVLPDGVFYVYFNASSTGLDTQTFCHRALEEAHVAFTPGQDFSTTTTRSHVRLFHAVSRDELREGMERLETSINNL